MCKQHPIIDSLYSIYSLIILNLFPNCFLLTVGYLNPSMSIETAPLSPYFAQRYFKVSLEFLFMCVLVHLIYTEYREVKARKSRRKALSIWAGKGGIKAKSTWKQALVEHFWSGDDPLSNIVDVATIVLGFGICIEWFVLTQHMDKAETALQHLHRPDGVVQYDDTDHDAWSDYHYEIEHIEHLVGIVMDDMVRDLMW